MYRIYSVELEPQTVITGANFIATVTVIDWAFVKKNFTWQTLKEFGTWGDLIGNK